jgi:hypothetical protein
MDAIEGEQHGPVVEPDRVLATYQHIRQRWGFKNADTARMKAKRAGWAQLPKNNPSEMTRLIVPRDQWDAVGDRSPGTFLAVLGPKRWGDGAGSSPRTAEVVTLPDLTARLTAVLGKLEKREATELQEARALAEQRAVELAELRERVGRAEAERDQARAERERAERQAAQVQAELAEWTAGGPVRRALRAFLYRR